MGQLVKRFGKIKVTLPIPHLLGLQVDSYRQFLQVDSTGAKDPDIGLEAVFLVGVSH